MRVPIIGSGRLGAVPAASGVDARPPGHSLTQGVTDRPAGRTSSPRLRAGTREAALALQRRAFRMASRVAELAFDRTFDVRTRGEVHNETQLTRVSVCPDPYDYEPANLLLWWRMVRAIPAQRSRTTFVDLGAGRGRPAILAAQSGYGRVLGVELDERLVREAQANVRRWRARRPQMHAADVQIVHGDAAVHPLPGGPLVICIYNAFGPATLRLVLRRICETPTAATCPTFLAYLNPLHSAVVAEFPRLALHSGTKRWAVYRLQPDSPALGSGG